MELLLNLGAFSGVFALPCDVVDRYMSEASLNDLKVLLYIFRCGPETAGGTRITDFLGLSEEEIRKSVDYWVSKKIFTYAGESRKDDEEPAKGDIARKVVDMPIIYSPDDVARKAEGNAEIKFLLESASDVLGKLLSPAECSTLVYLCDGAGIPAEVVLMIIEYCKSIGKGNLRYIEKTALGWADEGVSTLELAEEKIRRLEALHSFEGQVKTLMGIGGRALTQAERQHIARWCQEWNMPGELIRLAYETCVDRTGKISFSYINSVLKAWHEKGYTTEKEAKAESRPSGNKTAPSFDVDEYIRLSMKRLQNEKP